jgi:hypothetical protein
MMLIKACKAYIKETTSLQRIHASISERWFVDANVCLLNTDPFDSHVRAIAEKQRRISKIISTREKSRVVQMLTQIDGPQRYKNELHQVIAST